MAAWRGTIEVYGSTLNGLGLWTRRVLRGVLAAKTFKELPIVEAGGGGADSSTNAGGYHCQWFSPKAERIAQLRAEADKLEAELIGGVE